jgi:hypothetical protein
VEELSKSNACLGFRDSVPGVNALARRHSSMPVVPTELFDPDCWVLSVASCSKAANSLGERLYETWPMIRTDVQHGSPGNFRSQGDVQVRALTSHPKLWICLLSIDYASHKQVENALLVRKPRLIYQFHGMICKAFSRVQNKSNIYSAPPSKNHPAITTYILSSHSSSLVPLPSITS